MKFVVVARPAGTAPATVLVLLVPLMLLALGGCTVETGPYPEGVEEVAVTAEPGTDGAGEEPPVMRSKIDPRNDRTGTTGRDDNLGIYYHNSVDWRWLEDPGVIVPGARIYNYNGQSSCSTGFIASRDYRTFIITAGHCGRPGDHFYVRDDAGSWLYAGTMVESLLESGPGNTVAGVDIGLIDVTSREAPISAKLPLKLPLKGYITPAQAQKHNLMICRLGATTGYSCGRFEDIGSRGQFFYRAISDRGDSGGAIFAANSRGIWALGVVSNVSDTNKTYAGGMEIDSAMRRWGLTLNN